MPHSRSENRLSQAELIQQLLRRLLLGFLATGTGSANLQIGITNPATDGKQLRVRLARGFLNLVQRQILLAGLQVFLQSSLGVF